MSWWKVDFVKGARGRFHDDGVDRGYDGVVAMTGTGMHHAAANGHIEVLKLLLEYHADIEHRNKNLETPLLFATRRVRDLP